MFEIRCMRFLRARTGGVNIVSRLISGERKNKYDHDEIDE